MEKLFGPVSVLSGAFTALRSEGALLCRPPTSLRSKGAVLFDHVAARSGALDIFSGARAALLGAFAPLCGKDASLLSHAPTPRPGTQQPSRRLAPTPVMPDVLIPRRHHRARRFVKWAMALLAILFLALYAATYVGWRTCTLTPGPVRPFARAVASGDPNGNQFKWERDETFTILADGWILRRTYPVYTGGDFTQEPTQSINSIALQWATYDAPGYRMATPLTPKGVAGITLAIPLWPLFVPPAIAALYLFRRDRRLRHVGHCLRCQYDLRTIPQDALCPECGSNARIGP